MTDMADCWVMEGFRNTWAGTARETYRPMTLADLDSLIRERGVTDEMVERALDIIALEGFTERSRRLIVEGVLEAALMTKEGG